MPSPPCTGEPRTGDSIPGVASSVQGGEWPLHLLAMPFLMQPMCTTGHLFSKVSDGTNPSSFSAALLSSHPRFSFPGAGMRIFLCWQLQDACLLTFSAYWDSSEQLHRHQVCHALLWVLCPNPLRVALGPIIQVIDEDVTQHWFQYQPLGSTPRDWPVAGPGAAELLEHSHSAILQSTYLPCP